MGGSLRSDWKIRVTGNILNEYNSPLFGMGVAYSRSLGIYHFKKPSRGTWNFLCVWLFSLPLSCTIPSSPKHVFFVDLYSVSLDQAFVVFVPCYYWCWTLKHMLPPQTVAFPPTCQRLCGTRRPTSSQAAFGHAWLGRAPDSPTIPICCDWCWVASQLGQCVV